MERRQQRQDDEVQNVLATISAEGDQLDAIASIRGWFQPNDNENLILKQYMTGTLSLPDTVNALADPIDELYTSGDNGWSKYNQEQAARDQRQYNPDPAIWGVEQDVPSPEGPDEGYPTTEGFLWSLWFAVMHTAKKTPWQDEIEQDKLLGFVKALKARPNPPLPEDITLPMQQDWIYKDGHVWSQLSMMGPSFRECWNDSPGCGAGWSQPEVHAWVNANAFVARICATEVDDYWHYGVWALRDALEQQKTGPHHVEPPRKEDEQDLLLTTAAVWILVGGKKMWEMISQDQDFETHYGLDTDLPKLPWDGDGTWTRARWDFWKRMLAAWQGNRFDELSEHTRNLIGEAVQHMQKVET